MARESSDKPGRKPARGTAVVAGQPTGLSDRIATLEAERARLQAELGAANARISELETRQSEVADRIAWALDTLHTLLDDGG